MYSRTAELNHKSSNAANMMEADTMASTAQEQLRFAAYHAIAALLIFLAAIACMVEISIWWTVVVGVLGLALFPAAIWLVRWTPFGKRTIINPRAPHLEEISNPKNPAILNLKRQLESTCEQSRRWREKLTAFRNVMLVLTAVCLVIIVNRIYRERTVHVGALLPIPKALREYSPLLTDKARQPIVIANLVVKVLAPAESTHREIEAFLDAKGPVTSVLGACLTKDGKQARISVEKANASIDQIDGALLRIEQGPFPGEYVNDAKKARKKLQELRAALANAQNAPNPLNADKVREKYQAACQELVRFGEALAEFAQAIVDFTNMICSGGNSGQGISIETSRHMNVLVNKAQNGMEPTQREFDNLCGNLQRHTDTLAFKAPPGRLVANNEDDASASAPFADLCVPPVLVPTSSPKRDVDRSKVKTQEKLNPQQPPTHGPIAPPGSGSGNASENADDPSKKGTQKRGKSND